MSLPSPNGISWRREGWPPAAVLGTVAGVGFTASPLASGFATGVGTALAAAPASVTGSIAADVVAALSASVRIRSSVADGRAFLVIAIGAVAQDRKSTTSELQS